MELKDKDLVKHYLDRLFYRHNSRICFEPWAILADASLARSLCSRLSNKSKRKDVSGVCIMAGSGIPLGVMVAQELGLPIFFFSRRPFHIDDVGLTSIFPIPPEGTKLLLVDSHTRSGYTTSTCFHAHKLLRKNISPVEVLTPITFEDSRRQGSRIWAESMKYTYLSKSSPHVDSLLEKNNINTVDDLHKILEEKRGEDPGETLRQYFPSLKSRKNAILSSITKHKKLSNLRIADPEFAELLNKRIGSNEADIWELFTRPSELKEYCLKIGNLIGIEQFDILAGTKLLGTSLAIAIAWHNNFKGPIISTYQPGNLGFLNPKQYKNGLIISGRIRTGLFIRGMIEKLNTQNIAITEAVVLRDARQGVKFPRNLMIYNELEKIEAMGCSITTLS